LRKVHPDFDALAGAILRADRRGRLIFLADREPGVTAALAARLRDLLPDVAGRLGFLPRLSEADYLGLLAASDVILDTPHYGGGANTCLDAAATATPVVTLPGTFHRGRWAYAVANALGLQDGVAGSSREYIAYALTLGTDRAYGAEVRARIRASAAALFERLEPARELADFVLNAAAP
jgi:predicted O-linked N-acetylglucosamine transferase (SPINDLY family)